MTLNPYYTDDAVTLYHGDCREVSEWLGADVLVTDPPYGIGWVGSRFGATNYRPAPKRPIANDLDTYVRDHVLAEWGTRPALTFGAPLLPAPQNAHQVVVWHKPPNTGLLGTVTGWRRDWEAIYITGEWPKRAASRSSVISTRAGMRAYLPTGGHPHAKPIGLLVSLLEMVPQGVVADPFAGTGTTLAAAKHLGKTAIGVELDERWCEVAANRLSQEVLDFGGAA